MDNLMDNELEFVEKVADIFFNKAVPINYETDQRRVIVDENVPVINFKNNNLKGFKIALAEYVQIFLQSDKYWTTLNEEDDNDIEDRIFYALIAALINMTYDDFEHPIDFIKRYTCFLQDKTFDDFVEQKTLKNIQTLNNCNIAIALSEQRNFAETPESIVAGIEKSGKMKLLPRVSYGIANNTAYIYAIQGYGNETLQELGFSNDSTSDEIKEIDRKRTKLNKSSKIPKAYKQDYLELEPYAYLSLFIFICLLKQKGIYKIKMPDFMPQRYVDHMLDEKYSNEEDR